MDTLDQVVKLQMKRAKRFLEKREPKLNENNKNAMLIKGGKCKCSSDKNITRTFEDQTSLEFFSKKSDFSLLMFGSYNKKWPNSPVTGRMYDYHVLDLIELGIENFVSLKDIKNSKCSEGTNPMLIFAADDSDVTEDRRRLKSLLIDFFRGPTVSNICLAGLEYVLHFTALNGKIYFQNYKLLPLLDPVLRRTHLALDDLYKLSMKMPKALKPKKKNISHDTLGKTYGRIHMQKQDLRLKKQPAERITEDPEKKSKRILNN
uniref:Ribosome production factor 2 homolog n=1 Tax=Saimiri boliviensis boliviensis TaxID=39432 RepID=A0A2K6UXD2_SAIBB